MQERLLSALNPQENVDPTASSEKVIPTEGTAKLKRKTHFWLRWTLVYTSMISLIIVLFFGITGITLNHPDWTFGTEAQATTDTGILPVDAITDGEVEFLVIREFVRNTQGVKGHVTNFGTDAAEGTIISKTLVVGQRSFSTST